MDNFRIFEPEVNEKLSMPYLVQSVSKKDSFEKQRSAFGASGYYGGFNPRFYNKLTKIFNVDSMGYSEFEGEKFPNVLKFLTACIERNLIFLGNFKLQNGRLIYYMCHENLKKQIPKVLLSWEKSIKSQKKHHTKSNDKFEYSIKKNSDSDTIGWFCINQHYFFSTSKNASKEFYLLLKKNRTKIGVK